MKRLVLVLVAAAALSTAAFADHPNTMGVGVVAGSGVAGSDIGLALKLPSMPLYWQFNVHLSSAYIGLGATGDRYFYDQTLLKEGSFRLDWFLGAGGYVNLGFGDSLSASLGARLPVGLSWHISPQFELWLDLVPSLGLDLAPFYFPDWNVGAELGFRVWLK